MLRAGGRCAGAYVCFCLCATRGEGERKNSKAGAVWVGVSRRVTRFLGFGWGLMWVLVLLVRMEVGVGGERWDVSMREVVVLSNVCGVCVCVCVCVNKSE